MTSVMPSTMVSCVMSVPAVAAIVVRPTSRYGAVVSSAVLAIVLVVVCWF